MSVKDLILEIECARGKIKVEGDHLHINAPEGALTPALLKKIADQKRDIITYLNDFGNGFSLPMTVTGTQEHYPVSSGQKRFWIQNQLDRDQIAYNIPSAYLIEGELDVDAFKRTLRTIVDRHEVLRTNIITIGGEPRQKVHDKASFSFQCEFLDITDEEEKGKIIEQEIQSQSTFSFDVVNGNLIIAKLIREQHDKYVFILTLHHIVTDGHSEGIFISEIAQLYNAYENGQGNPLPELTVQYRDFSTWQNQQLTGGLLQNHKEYWKSKMPADRPSMTLATDYPRPRLKTYNGKSADVVLDEGLSHNLLEIAKKSNVSPFMFLLAVVKVLLFRFSGQEDITVGTSVLGREHPDLGKMIGLFINPLPLRTRLDGNESFMSTLQHVRQTVLEAYEYQAYPFEQIVSDLGIKRDLSRSPFYDVTVDYSDEQHQTKSEDIGGLKVKSITPDLPTSQFELSFIFSRRGTDIILSIIYNTDLYGDATIQRFMTHCCHLMKSIISDPLLTLNELPVIPPSELNLLIKEFNNTDRPFQLGKTFVDMFEDQVEKSPDSVAVVDDQSELTYRELNTRANQVARLLVEKEIQQEELVPILCSRSLEMLIGIIGVFKAGAAYVPVDIEFPARRIITMLNDSKSRIVLTMSRSLQGRESLFAEICSETSVRDLIIMDTIENISKTRSVFYESFLAAIGKSRTTCKPYRGEQSQIPVELDQSLLAKIAALHEYLNKHRIGNTCVGILLDNKEYSIAAAVVLEERENAFININPALARKKKVGLIRDNCVSVILTEGKYLDEVDSLLWEVESLNTYILVDEPDKGDKDSIVKDIFNFETEKSIEEVNDFGWVSSYDGKPFSQEVMQQYIDNFCDKLSPFLTKDTKVLEIGCGHGLVLSNIAQKTGYYCATDLSDKVIERHRKRFSDASLAHVDFKVLSAKDINRIDKKGFFDVIVSSSVIHFFPNTIYLEDVIKNALDLLTDQGVIYIDQILDLSKKEAMVRANVEFNSAHGVKTAKIHWDDDLFLDKRFFYDLQVKFPEITSLEFSEQNGAISNELKEFRYDLIIKVDKKNKIRTSTHPPSKNRLSDLRLDQAVYQPDYQSSALGNLMKIYGEVIDGNRLKEYPGDNLSVKPKPGSLSFVIYTSGSTGKPKGTMNEHIGMLNHCFIMIENLSLDHHSVIAQTAPHCFDISVWQFITALIVGGKTVIYSNETVLLPDSWIEKVYQDNVSIIQLVPSYLAVILDIFQTGKSTTYFSKIRQLLVCGEVIKPLFVKNWFDYFPNIKMANVYGPAEASDDVTMHVMDKFPSSDTILIGRPLQNCRIYILDHYNNVYPIGCIGEICVSGICVGRGYLNDQAKTQSVFMDDPFRPGVRMYKTGDLGRFLPSGEIEFFGRRDYQVKIRAQRIELGEIENKLVEIPGIKNAIVIDRLDELNNKYLCAYILVERDSTEVRGEEIKSILRNDLPEVMIPSFVISMFEFPLTPNGKVNRNELPRPDSSNETDIVHASNPAEKKMLEIWKHVLGDAAVSVRSNFFEIGGHSLKAALVVSRVLKEFNVRIALKDLFLHPTVEGLCGVIMQKEKEDSLRN